MAKMCGLAGIMSGSASSSVGARTVAMTRALAHRGPDDDGFMTVTDAPARRTPEQALTPARVALGHRRLSIVDIAGGGQPMSDVGLTTWVTFNGEIYNHRELRRELEHAGRQFRTRSDTEVLVHGYNVWGDQLFPRLNGIFAIAIYDALRDEVVLARDPVGVKPLYLGTRDGVTWWSSELGAAHAADLVSAEFSPEALKLFLAFRFVPSPRTIYDDVWKIPPGHSVWLARIDAGRPPAFSRYTSSIRSTAQPATRREWSEALFVELEGAVKRQLMSDVPVSVLLSGGVDSSLITRFMTGSLPTPPMSFGIGFGSEADAGEAAAAQSAATSLGVPHSSTVIGDQEYIDAWPASFAELGQPIANGGALLLQKPARQSASSSRWRSVDRAPTSRSVGIPGT